MGEVYEAFDTRLRRPVALKILTSAVDASQAELRQLLVEARSLAALQHRNVVTIYDVGEHDGVPYLTMELLRGRSLAATTKAREGSLSERVRWLLELASALGAVHRSGLVHRDVKPGNVMITEDRRAVLFDFGIARPVEPNVGTFDGQSVRGGMLIGTPRYMAPELTAGTRASVASDQYAWGVIAAQLLTDERPSPEWDIARSLAAASIASPLRAIVLRAADRFAPNRFGSMDEIVSALESLGETSVHAPKRRSMLPAVLVASASLVVGGVGGTLAANHYSRARTEAAHSVEPIASNATLTGAVTSASATATPLVPLAPEPTAEATSSASAPTALRVTHPFVAHASQRECSVDADCGCGVSKSTGVCAVGPLERIDTSRRCPDFCEGFDGNFVTTCRAGRCINARP